MSSSSKENVRNMLKSARANPTKENIVALHKALVHYVDAQLVETSTSTRDKLEAITKELGNVRSAKAIANASLAQAQKELVNVKAAKEATDAALSKMQNELGAIRQALDACKSTAESLEKRAEVVEDSINVVKLMRNNTAHANSM